MVVIQELQFSLCYKVLSWWCTSLTSPTKKRGDHITCTNRRPRFWLVQGTNQAGSFGFLGAMLATKRNVLVDFYIAPYDLDRPAPTYREPKKNCRIPIAPLVSSPFMNCSFWGLHVQVSKAGASGRTLP
jgi:hypothetical protein